MEQRLTDAGEAVLRAVSGLPPEEARYLLRFAAARLDRPDSFAAEWQQDRADRKHAGEAAKTAARGKLADLMAHYNVTDVSALAAKLSEEGGALVQAAGTEATTNTKGVKHG